MHTPLVLSEADGAYALLSERPEAAVVFVHGFYGNSRSTWRDFQTLVDTLESKFPAWGRCDLVFYRYRSWNQPKPLAEQFRSFIQQVFPRSPDGRKFFPPRQQNAVFAFPSGGSISATVQDGQPRPYTSIVLVGHSTGGLLIREAVLQEMRRVVTESSVAEYDASFILASRLRLFAPAHRGAMCSGVLGALMRAPISEWIITALLYSNPLFMCLQPSSSPLEDIRRETEQLQRKFNSIGALFAQSLFGENETIVYDGKYAGDPELPTEREQTHQSICKPSQSYTKPLEFAIDATFRRAAGF